MQIELPQSTESFVKSQAAAAGFDSVADYVVNLVRQDEESRRYLDAIASDSRIEAVALKGIESGPVQPFDIDALRQEYREKIGRQQ